MKRRELVVGEEIILIYDVNIGFIQQSAKFKEYRSIIYNEREHKIPVFERKHSEITGLECFWLKPSDIDDDARIEQIQRELIELQLKAFEVGERTDSKVPEKIHDKEIRQMAKQYAEFRTSLVKELGYDPLDYSWVERELAETPLERLWFKFQRERKGSFDDNWEKTAKLFHDIHHKKITSEEAFDLCRKWKRYIIGAWNTIAAQNANIEDWKTAAKRFEKHHRDIETRMTQWNMAHKDNYPLAKVKSPVHFQHGPYFNECLERIPKFFVDATCYQLREGVVLEVVSYDPKLRYIRLDFTSDIREKIKPGIPRNDPWRPMRADYVIYIPPDQIDEQLEFLGSLGDAYLRVDEFMQDGETIDVAEQVRRETLEERRKTVLDLDAIREQETWSNLADKVVGAEDI